MNDWRWRKRTKNGLVFALAFLMLAVQLLGGIAAGAAYADDSGGGAGQTRTVTIQQAVGEAADWILAQGPVRDHWFAYTLALAGRTVESGYFDWAAEQASGYTGATAPSDYARLALAVQAAGGNPASFGGVDLLERIYNHDNLAGLSVSHVIYSLIALDSGDYTIPADAEWDRERMISFILERQIAGQGWSWSLAADAVPDLDTTGAALWALAPYRDRTDVQGAVEGASAWIASQQFEHGDLAENRDNSNSLAMAVLGLSKQEIDGRQGEFARSDGDLVTALFRYFNADGGFRLGSGGSSNSFATYQAALALIAYDAFAGGGETYEVPAADDGPSAKATVFVHIETPEETIAEGTELAAHPLEALQLLANRHHVRVETEQTAFGLNIVSVGDVVRESSPRYLYWSHNIKRDGEWLDTWGWDSTALRDGDEVVIFFTDGNSRMLKDIALTPPSPKEGEPFAVKVTQFPRYDEAGDTVTDSVYVTIGGQKVRSDEDGVAHFPQGYDFSAARIEVTGTLVDGFPTLIRGTKKLPARVSVRVEGPYSTIAAAEARGYTPYEALANTVTEVVYTDGMYFSVDEIDGVQPELGHWWGYGVRRAGVWADTGAWNGTPLLDGDELVVYYSADDTKLVGSVTVTPALPKAGQAFTVKVMQKEWLGVSPASGAKVTVGALEAATDESGAATFGGLPAGTYTLTVTGYRDNAPHKLVKHTSSLAVSSGSGSGGGGGGGTPSDTVTLRVVGDDSMGTLVSARSVERVNGDTAYSVLVRELSADRVESTGTGDRLYVSGIDGLREFDRGPKSGWKYAVNCVFPTPSAGLLTVKRGDRVDWLYTLDGGDDVKAELQGACSAAVSGSGGSPVSMPTDIGRAVQDLPIGYNNRTPADPDVRTVIVLNAGARMNADALQRLREELGGAPVRLSRTFAADEAVVLADSKGEVKLEVPENGFSGEKSIVIAELEGEGAPEQLSPLYEFEPDGTVFDKPVQVTIKVPLDADDLEKVAFVWLDEATGKWIPIPAVVDAATGIVTGLVDHFTKFAVIDKSKLPAAPDAALRRAVDAAARFALADGEVSDWEAYALAGAGAEIPASYRESVEQLLRERQGELRLVTDLERMALGYAAAGGNPRDAAGYDLIERIANHERMLVQGTNGPIFALLVLSADDYALPSDAAWTRENLIAWLLQQQNGDGGWGLVHGDGSNVDLTAMALASLAPYRERADVERSVGKALDWLSANQQVSGGFRLEGQENSESAAQVLLALVRLGIDVNDPKFTKYGDTVLSNLLSYQQEDGGFAHVKGEPSNAIATEQALLALALLRKAEAALPVEASPMYTDQADIAGWALDYVERAHRYGLMEGVGGEMPRFAPKEPLTRAQFVRLVLKTLDSGSTSGGAAAGETVGAADGASDGETVGAADGASDGETIGAVDGALDGETVGAADGASDGAQAGEADSPAAGASDGAVGTPAAFADVAPDSWYAADVAEAVRRGIVAGVSAEAFAPDRPIARQEMALVLARAFRLDAAAAADESEPFADLGDAYELAVPSIRAVQANGFMEGAGQGRFLPADPVTREMAAAVIVRVYEKTR